MKDGTRWDEWLASFSYYSIFLGPEGSLRVKEGGRNVRLRR